MKPRRFEALHRMESWREWLWKIVPATTLVGSAMP